MFKQIQLRGISRTPSDRMTSDGGCSESLNVRLEERETAPAIAPRDVTQTLTGSPGQYGVDYVHIHKTASYTNYITLSSANMVGAYVGGVYVDTGLSLGNEVLKSVTSVGNTLVVITDRDTHYVLYKEGAYVCLGTRIPEPLVDFRAEPVTVEMGARFEEHIYLSGSLETNGYDKDPDHHGGYTNVFYQLFNQSLYGYEANYSISGVYTQAFVSYCSSNIWEMIKRMEASNRGSGYFSAPVFARSAVRLYDGSHIYQSAPVLLGLGFNQFVDVMYEGVNDDDEPTTSSENPHFYARLNTVYKITATVNWPLGDWKDIIESLEISLSQNIYNPVYNSRIERAEEMEGSFDMRLFFKDQTGYDQFGDIREAVLSKSLFYSVESIAPDDLTDGMEIEIKPLRQEELVVRPQVQDDALSHHGTLCTGAVVQYNQRLIMCGTRTRLYTGHPFLTGVYHDFSMMPETGAYSFKYHLRSDDGSAYSVIGRSADGSVEFSNVLSGIYPGFPCGWMYYPDPRCFKVEIYTHRGWTYSIPMKPHPLLNGAYALCGLGTAITSISDGSQRLTQYPEGENPFIYDRNRVVMTEVANPFFIPTANRLTFTGEVIDAATTTKALSEGQFGQYPLYVFTKGGIHAVSIGDDGRFVSSAPVSRDVALSEEAVTPVDQAIVFVTAKGVKLLTGSDIKDLSPNMNGGHYVIPGPVRDCLEHSRFSHLVPALTDATPFLTFMRGASAVYDYAGARLVFFRSDKTYQYVYALDTRTWHKLCLLPSEARFSRVLNGYPDALVSMRGGRFGIYDFSSFPGGGDTVTALKGAVVTRTLDLDNDGVRKTVRRILLRGQYAGKAAQWMLMASNDGVTYHVIHSLRGCSYKFFRIILLLDLKPWERFSYIGLDYETRFTEKNR